MRRATSMQFLCLALGGLVLTAGTPVLTAARADQPTLVVRVIGGADASYALAEIERLGFDGEETLVVVTAAGADRYANETIERIEFLWEPAAVKDPAEAARLLTAIRLFQNQPNPFSPETRIVFDLPAAGKAELSIYSPDGRLVRALVSGERPAGRQEAVWDGLDDAGRAAPGGVYFYALSAPGVTESRRMILLPR